MGWIDQKLTHTLTHTHNNQRMVISLTFLVRKNAAEFVYGRKVVRLFASDCSNSNSGTSGKREV